MSSRVNVEDLVQPGMMNLNLKVMVQRVDRYDLKTLEDGREARFLFVADSTANIDMLVVPASLSAQTSPGDILRIKNAYTAMYGDRLILFLDEQVGRWIKEGDFEMNVELSSKKYMSKFDATEDETTKNQACCVAQ